MRRDGDSLICCELSVRERDAVDEMKVRGGFHTDANLLRTALFHYARHFEVALDTALFAIRNQQDRRAARVVRAVTS